MGDFKQAMESTQWNSILLTDLPVEILEIILSCDDISCADICRFSETCSLFKYVASSNKLWRLKYKKEWLESTFEDGSDVNWMTKYRSRYEFNKVVDTQVDSLSEEFYLQDNISNEAFYKFNCHQDESVIPYQTLIYELERRIHDGQSSENLTKKYYAKKVLRYVRHMQLKEVWKNFLAEPEQNQCLEIGACLLAQWCQTSRTCCTKQVLLEIDNFAESVKKKIQILAPKHPVLHSNLYMQDLSQSLWLPSQCRVVLLCINEFLFKEQKFGYNAEDEYYSADNSYIDRVLIRKNGIHTVLGILYIAIARRLGVHCQPVNYLGHFLLKWLEHPQLDDDQAFTYIDIHNDGAFRTHRECYSLSNEFQPRSKIWFDPVTPAQVYIRMCWNLVEIGRHVESLGEGPVCLCNALELLSILNPKDAEHKLLLSRLYLHLCINLADVISMIQEVTSSDPTSTGAVSYMYQVALNQLQIQKCWISRQEIVPKARGENCPVKFAVGMIMKHMKYNYRCVIYAWDTECAASSDWIKQMGVHNLAFKEHQPFYHVLANDGTNRYAAQENLELDLERKPIVHNDVGRYFESYRGTHYIPNKQKTMEYPDDALVRESIFSFGEFFTYKDMCNNPPDNLWD